jgi:hypothetical protein
MRQMRYTFAATVRRAFTAAAAEYEPDGSSDDRDPAKVRAARNNRALMRTVIARAVGARQPTENDEAFAYAVVDRLTGLGVAGDDTAGSDHEDPYLAEVRELREEERTAAAHAALQDGVRRARVAAMGGPATGVLPISIAEVVGRPL